MKLYLVRHGQTDFNAERRIASVNDPSLNSVGVAQAEAITPLLPTGLQAIYCSSLLRAKQTAEILNRGLNLPLHLTPALNEKDFGSLTGKLWEEVGEEIKKIDREHKYDYRPHGGESAEDVQQRLQNFMTELKANSRYEKVLVVTSDGIMRLLYYLRDGYIAANTEEIEKRFGNASIHEFTI